MIFWASAEVGIDANPAMERARRCVEPYLNAAFAESTLGSLAVEIRYIPIVMPAEARHRYPARSKLRKKQRLYDCAPQLNYDVFVSGSFEHQLREYVRGISESTSYLAELGANERQVADFRAILDSAVEKILETRPDQTRQ